MNQRIENIWDRKIKINVTIYLLTVFTNIKKWLWYIKKYVGKINYLKLLFVYILVLKKRF